MAIVLVEQYFDFACQLADRFAVMDRGQIIVSGTQAEMTEAHVRRHLTV
jgi:urea transport system ATP-binding protein